MHSENPTNSVSGHDPQAPASEHHFTEACKSDCECMSTINATKDTGDPSLETAHNAWVECSKRLRDHDKELANVWKEEIDNLLVFTGLFAAVLAAFNVAVFIQLDPGSTPDATLQVLLRISAQLGSLHIENNSIASVQPPFPNNDIVFSAAKSSIWVNSLWFTSLILSLSTASAAIVARQWIGYFASIPIAEARESTYIHFLRYDKGLIAWGVPQILSILPVLLQSSLFLFFIGLAILLWSLNKVVAIVSIIFIGISLLFFVFTTFAPSIWLANCPYRSPQALVAYWLVQYSCSILVFILYAFYHLSHLPRYLLVLMWRRPPVVQLDREIGEPLDVTHDLPRSTSDTQQDNMTVLRKFAQTICRGIRYCIQSSLRISGLVDYVHSKLLYWQVVDLKRIVYAMLLGVSKSLRDWAKAHSNQNIHTSWSKQERDTIDKNLQIARAEKLQTGNNYIDVMSSITWEALISADVALSDDTFLNDVIRPFIDEPMHPLHTAIEHVAEVIRSRKFRVSATNSTLPSIVFGLAQRMRSKPDVETVLAFGSILGDLVSCCDWSNTVHVLSTFAEIYQLYRQEGSSQGGAKYRNMKAAEFNVVSDAFAICVTEWRKMDESAPLDGTNVKHSDVENIVQFSRSLTLEHTYDKALATSILSTCIALRLASRLPPNCYSVHVRQPLRDLLGDVISECQGKREHALKAYDIIIGFISDAKNFVLDHEIDMIGDVEALERWIESEKKDAEIEVEWMRELLMILDARRRFRPL